MSVNWDDIRILLAVARSGSLSRAAARLEIDQSTVSRRLSALESALGAKLFKRSHVGLVLTETGAAILQHATEVEGTIGQIIEQAAAPDAGPSGLVRLITNAWILRRLSQTMLPAFMQTYPEIALRLLAKAPSAPIRSDATISLWFEAPPHNGDIARPLGAVPFALYHRKDHDPDQLNWVSFYDEDAPDRAPLRHLRKLGHAAETLPLTASDADLVHVLIAQGAGKGFLPRCMGDPDPTLVALADGPHSFSRILYLHTHPDLQETPRVRALSRALHDQFAAVFLPRPAQ
ncbi:LysR family transcriptional regulator [Abyssibius alkaniclasticus]|uniref:LysR family transcriptional regulator n=1 Tax=Abyssibius alkaniclasticus TaxID=2881234 RepID=UPI0023633479|nr:LysR family transcriptional regulator [Abyssibius alkaniclasticus]UPH71659.1 LysR family transcriptional regulator [Abyssibius alkaniclasticus]